MNEWGVITVIVTLAALVGAIAGPIVKLNSTITKLSTIIDYALKRLDELEKKDEKFLSERKTSHEKIHKRIDEQSEVLQNHETRIQFLERKEQT